MNRRCTALAHSGEPCRARPLRDGAYCFLHEPDRAGEAADARRLGGLRRRREGTISAAFELGEIDTLDGQWRLLEVIVTDAIGLTNGVERVRVLLAAVALAAKLREATEVDARILALEAATGARRRHRDAAPHTASRAVPQGPRR